MLRERNEALQAPNAATHWVDPPYPDWLCECANLECSERVQLTIEEYEGIRAEPRRFVIAPDEKHTRPDDEQVVATTDRFWVVEKIGVAAEVSEALDPRGGA